MSSNVSPTGIKEEDFSSLLDFNPANGIPTTNARAQRAASASANAIAVANSQAAAAAVMGTAADTSSGTTGGSEDTSKKGKRKSHTKSRRGCLTCKRRRVKCDETHPKCNNCQHLDLVCSFEQTNAASLDNLNIMDIRLFYHYTCASWKTIVSAGISTDQVWGVDVPQLAFEFPFLMHAILTFSASHLIHAGDLNVPPEAVTLHRSYAYAQMSQYILDVTPDNVDAMVAASVLLILDAFANAAPPEAMHAGSLPPSAWLTHVRGAATILLAVGEIPPTSRFYHMVSLDLSDLAERPSLSTPEPLELATVVQRLVCFDDDLADLYPVSLESPYLHALILMDKLFHQRYKSDFILRVFSLPALLDTEILELLNRGDDYAQRIIKVYYKLVKSFTAEMKDSVWFLEGVAQILPIDLDAQYGGLGFITEALPVRVALDEMENLYLDESSVSGSTISNQPNLDRL